MERLKQINVPMVLLCLITARLLFSSDSYATSAIAVSLVALYGYSQYLNSKKVKPLDESVRHELEVMRNQISNINVKTNLNQPKPTQKFF